MCFSDTVRGVASIGLSGLEPPFVFPQWAGFSESTKKFPLSLNPGYAPDSIVLSLTRLLFNMKVYTTSKSDPEYSWLVKLDQQGEFEVKAMSQKKSENFLVS